MSEKPLKVNLGCRTRPLPTYTNVDIDPTNQYADVIDNAFELKTFKDNSISNLDAVHMYEHLSLEESDKALKVWFAKLKSGGTLRLSVPDMTKTSALLLLTNDKDLVKSMIVGSQRDSWDFHRNFHTKDSLTKDLEKAGFKNIINWEWQKTWPYNYIDSYASAYWPHFRKDFIMDNGKRVDLGGVLLSLNLECQKP